MFLVSVAVALSPTTALASQAAAEPVAGKPVAVGCEARGPAACVPTQRVSEEDLHGRTQKLMKDEVILFGQIKLARDCGRVEKLLRDAKREDLLDRRLGSCGQ